MAKLSCGGDERAWHCCQLDNLHRTGIGWDGCAKVRAGEESILAREAARGRKEPQVSIAAQFSQLGALELSLFVTKQSQRTSKRVLECYQDKSGGREARERGKASHEPISQQGDSKSLSLSQSTAKESVEMTNC